MFISDGIFLLFILYLTNVWTLKPGFSITAFFYFSLGAYEAIKGNNIIVRSKQCIYLAFPISTFLLVFYLILYGSGIIWGTFVSRLYIIMFIPVLFAGLCADVGVSAYAGAISVPYATVGASVNTCGIYGSVYSMS